MLITVKQFLARKKTPICYI